MLHSRLPPYQQVIPIPQGWHHALALHTHTEELLSLGPLCVHREHPFEIFHRQQGSTGSHRPQNGNIPDSLTPRPFFRSRQGQSPGLEGTSLEDTLALKGSEVGLYRPNGDPKVLGQFSDGRWISLPPEAILNERDRFELSYATRLNRGVGLYFGLRRVEATSHLAGTEPPVVTEIVVMALLERAQRQNGLCSCEAPALAFALHPVLDHGPAGRLDVSTIIRSSRHFFSRSCDMIDLL